MATKHNPFATPPPKLTVQCWECGEWHGATYDHEGRWGQGPIYAVVCTRDNLVDYYQACVVVGLDES